MSYAIHQLSSNSYEITQLWEQLDNADTPEEIDLIWESIIDEQETTTDRLAEIAEQLDADIIAIKARKQHLVELHDSAIAKLQQWRNRLDSSILKLNEQGLLPDKISGKQRQIEIRYNPPSCEILVDPELLPEEYQNIKTQVTANKKGIASAWRQGIPVEGTKVYRKPKVVYKLR